MFKYLWMVTQDLFLTVTFITLLQALLVRVSGKPGKTISRIGLCAGVIASVIMAAVKFNTRLIISSHWNHYLYAVILLLTALLFLFTALFARREGEDVPNGLPFTTDQMKRRATGSGSGTGIRALPLCIVAALLSAVLVFYSLPGVLLYPFSFNTMGQGYFSSYYLVRMAGWLGAFLLLLVYSRLLSRCALFISPYGTVPVMLNTGILSFAVYCFGRYFVPWVNRAKWLKWPFRYNEQAHGWIGALMMFTANHSMLFIYIPMAIVAVLAILLFRQGTIIREPYENPAQLRKLKARNRHWRRVAIGILICLALCLLILTVVKISDTQQVELSAPETFTVDEAAGVILVPMENVNDGHLHRFEYKTDKNIHVRWIVVKKPNSAVFGVGLDACEVCGNAGYFERNGQIICKRCDVVMNINTIGFKGGCNPIPLAYELKDGQLAFKLSDIIAGEKEFR